MSDHVLIVDSNSLLNSGPIQIIHKHPDFSHKRRTDLDPWEFISTSYPIAIASKIIPFLNTPTSPTISTRARTKSPDQRKSTSRRRSPAKSSGFNVQTEDNDTTMTPKKPTLTQLPTPYLTPGPSDVNLITATPGTTDTICTSRTITPGGTLFSPLKPLSDIIIKEEPSSLTTNPRIIPTALFTPSKTGPIITLPAPTSIAISTSLTCQPTKPRSLYTFTSTPSVIAHGVSLPTLTLKHDLPTFAIRDVFEWCHASVSAGRIVALQGWLVRFRDTARVREIREVCLALGLDFMARHAESTLDDMETGVVMSLRDFDT